MSLKLLVADFCPKARGMRKNLSPPYMSKLSTKYKILFTIVTPPQTILVCILYMPEYCTFF